MKKNIKKQFITFLVILIILPIIFYLKFNFKSLVADIKYPIKDINTEFFIKMDNNDLNNILLILKEKRVRYYKVKDNDYTYYKDKIWWEINTSDNIRELDEMKLLMIKNGITWIYQDIWKVYFDYWNIDFELWYLEKGSIEIWDITNAWRVEKLINENWFIIRKCNEFICEESK